MGERSFIHWRMMTAHDNFDIAGTRLDANSLLEAVFFTKE